MPKTILQVATLLLALCAPMTLSNALAQTRTSSGLEISGAWTRATPPGAKVAGGYVKVTNTGTAPDRLVGGKFALSERVEIHSMSMSDGIMKMEQVSGGLEIKPGETVQLKPGGLHLMFMGLSSDVKQGKPIAGALKFEKAGDVAVEFAVAPLGAKSPDAHSGHDHHGMKDGAKDQKHEGMDHKAMPEKKEMKAGDGHHKH